MIILWDFNVKGWATYKQEMVHETQGENFLDLF